jgi:hypothetical protein
MNGCRLRIGREDFNTLHAHLFPGDGDEHGAVLLAGASIGNTELTLSVREVHLAKEGSDYVEGTIGYRALTPTFIHRMITRARDERLVYLAVHNHDSDLSVGFSFIDYESHERGYPALLQIARGMPVGALVLGRRSMQADVWFPNQARIALDQAVVVGNRIDRLLPNERDFAGSIPDTYDRQLRLFGQSGQQLLSRCHVGVIGLGGIGSLVAEYLGRLGVGQFTLVDPDQVESSNLSRIVGGCVADANSRTPKAVVAERVIKQANPDALVHSFVDDVAKESVAKSLKGCDYLFLAADSMRARLVVNALIHQYLIPGVQMGSKVHADRTAALADVMSANRPVRPGRGCLWCNQLIDPTQLAKESKTEDERRFQDYGTEQPNPSVITLNAVSAAHAVNDFMLDFLGLRPEPSSLQYEHFHFLKRSRSLVEPRVDVGCSECARTGRYARGDAMPLPCVEG